MEKEGRKIEEKIGIFLSKKDFNLVINSFKNFLFLSRNLKISNILIDNGALLKITDLNIFVRTPNLLEKLKSTSSAPEVLLRNELTAKSDVWSIGIVLIEVSISNIQ